MTIQKNAGLLFIFGAIAVNIPYALLISNFSYPDILREPGGVVMTAFFAGGSGLVYTWLAFALTGLPLLFATILLGTYWNGTSKALVNLATTFGLIGLVAQLVGLLRWVFVIPILAENYVAPGSSEIVRESSVVAFQVVNQFGGVLLGEYIGQLFSILSMFLFSILILQRKLLKKWVAWLGFLASAVYLLAQGELYHTVLPSFPVLDIAGFAGSVLWILWLIALGTLLLLQKEGQTHNESVGSV